MDLVSESIKSVPGGSGSVTISGILRILVMVGNVRLAKSAPGSSVSVGTISGMLL